MKDYLPFNRFAIQLNLLQTTLMRERRNLEGLSVWYLWPYFRASSSFSNDLFYGYTTRSLAAWVTRNWRCPTPLRQRATSQHFRLNVDTFWTPKRSPFRNFFVSFLNPIFGAPTWHQKRFKRRSNMEALGSRIRDIFQEMPKSILINTSSKVTTFRESKGFSKHPK